MFETRKRKCVYGCIHAYLNIYRHTHGLMLSMRFRFENTTKRIISYEVIGRDSDSHLDGFDLIFFSLMCHTEHLEHAKEQFYSKSCFFTRCQLNHVSAMLEQRWIKTDGETATVSRKLKKAVRSSHCLHERHCSWCDATFTKMQTFAKYSS